MIFKSMHILHNHYYYLPIITSLLRSFFSTVCNDSPLHMPCTVTVTVPVRAPAQGAHTKPLRRLLSETSTVPAALVRNSTIPYYSILYNSIPYYPILSCIIVYYTAVLLAYFALNDTLLILHLHFSYHKPALLLTKSNFIPSFVSSLVMKSVHLISSHHFTKKHPSIYSISI